MDKAKVSGMLGLARRAGKISLGTDAVGQAVQGRKACLIVRDEDVSERSAREITALSEEKHVPLVLLPAGLLEEAAGKTHVKVAAVTDLNFAKQIVKLCESTEEQIKQNSVKRGGARN